MKKILPILIALIIWLPASPALAAFGFERSITVDHTKVPNTDQTNYPVEVASTTYSFLATVANGGKVQNAQGFDIGFYTNSNCSTGKMAWEVERYLPTGDVVYFVKNATLSHTTDTVFYVCYGDSSITTDQSATTTVWDSLYASVWHFPNGSTLSANDSTTHAVNSTSINAAVTATTGQIDGGAVQTNTSGAEILAGSGSNFTKALGVTDFTFSAWFTPTLLLSHDNLLFQASQNARGFGVNINTSGQMDFYDRGIADHNIGSAGDVVINKRYFLAFTHINNTAATVAYLYNATDGTLKTYSQTQGYSDTTSTATGSIIIGNNDLLGRNWTGMYDEMRVSSGGASSGAARSADWVATDYNNGLFPDKTASSTAGFYTLGTETPFGPTASGLGTKVVDLAMWIINGSKVIF